jgi:hypothetical protein
LAGFRSGLNNHTVLFDWQYRTPLDFWRKVSPIEHRRRFNIIGRGTRGSIFRRAPQGFCGRVQSVDGLVGLATSVVGTGLNLLSSIGRGGRVFVGHLCVLSNTKPAEWLWFQNPLRFLRMRRNRYWSLADIDLARAEVRQWPQGRHDIAAARRLKSDLDRCISQYYRLMGSGSARNTGEGMPSAAVSSSRHEVNIDRRDQRQNLGE